MGLKNPIEKSVAAALLLLAALFMASCQKDEVEVQVEKPLFKRPEHFPPVVYNNAQNPLTEEGVALGRRLFYDNILSVDNTVNCGTCHAQVHAFADHGTKFSTGVGGKTGTRNSPALSNLAWYTSFMADGGINHLEVMPLAPIEDQNEMAESLPNVIAKLNADESYRKQFKSAFNKDKIDSQQMFFALAQFMKTMVSANSKYDQMLLGEASFNERESRGYALFKAHCVSCHTEPLTSDFSFANNGLDSIFADAGRGRITLQPQDSGKFKVPNLRNVALTYPYMHDGRFYSLKRVLQFYSNEVIENKNLDPRIDSKFNFSQQQQDDIIAFLQTLTDYEFLANDKISEPKK